MTNLRLVIYRDFVKIGGSKKLYEKVGLSSKVRAFSSLSLVTVIFVFN